MFEMIINNLDRLRDNKEEFVNVLKLLDVFLEEMHKKEPTETEHLMVSLTEVLYKKHFCKHTAKIAIEKMKPFILTDESDNALFHSITEYMDYKDLDEQKCVELVNKAYERATEQAEKFGMTAPKIKDVNEYDIYVAFAMVLSDYWCSTLGDINKVAMITYEWLSDIDADGTKTWKYLME